MSAMFESPVPRTALAALPTPLETATNLSRHLGINLLIKRDDLTGLAMGGNKVRQLEFLIADALEQKATKILATAAAQSNFCRMITAAARRVGLDIGLLLRGTPASPVQGNLLIDHLLGADIRFIDNDDPYDPAHQDTLRAWAIEEEARGEKPYVVHLHGGSTMGALMTTGYVAASRELDAQLLDRGAHPHHLYLAVGSGSTLAGLVVGSGAVTTTLSATRLSGVTVGSPAGSIVPRIREFVHSTSTLLNLPIPASDRFYVDESQRGAHYGAPTEEGLAAIRLMARTEALMLNPVYTGKAFAALVADVRNGTIQPGETVVFLNTGGDPLLFSYADVLAQSTSRQSTPG